MREQILSEMRVRKSRKLTFNYYALKSESDDYVKIYNLNEYLFYRCIYLEVGTIFMPAIFYIVSTPQLINGVFQKFVDVCQLLG